MTRRRAPQPTAVFDTYWKFAAERMVVYYRRLVGLPAPWTSDATIERHRFTNAYRVLDRVSQYLISSVAPRGDQAVDEVFFRVMLFKIFNRIETWELLCAEVGWPTRATYQFDDYDRVLTAALDRKAPIYSAAYIMPSAGHWGEARKHRNHLRLLETLTQDRTAQRVADSRSMGDAFAILRSYPSLGDFLSYQLVTDLNYTSLSDFDEMEFVVPGPGARDGIAKCFSSLGDYSEAEAIRWVAETQIEQFRRRGVEFLDLGGRPLQLIDCQNLFCEVDKYARVAHPDVAGRTGRTRIKQQFRPSGSIAMPDLPAGWSVSLDVGRIAAALPAAMHSQTGR